MPGKTTCSGVLELVRLLRQERALSGESVLLGALLGSPDLTPGTVSLCEPVCSGEGNPAASSVGGAAAAHLGAQNGEVACPQRPLTGPPGKPRLAVQWSEKRSQATY